jgi:hypothetical protein
MEQELKELFEKIFQVAKVTFDTWDPADESVREQKCLFIEIQNARNGFRNGRQISLVTGSAMIVARTEELPIGFFSKAIEQAPAELTKDLFFFDFETNNRRFRDIVARGFSFQYFFNSQYDPATGTIESVDVTVEEES